MVPVTNESDQFSLSLFTTGCEVIYGEMGRWRSDIPLPPAAWSIFRWSTVICRISAFSSLAEPFTRREGGSRKSPRSHTNDIKPQVGAYLLLKGAGNQSAQLAQAVVDSVPAPFFDDLAKRQLQRDSQSACVLVHLIMGLILTPRRLFLACT